MKLLSSPTSPFVRKVWVLIHEAGRQDAVDVVAPETDADGKSDVSDANPLGKIPTLVCDDGKALYDSRVICRYLDQQFGTALYPEARLFEALTLEATGDGILDSAVTIVYESRFRPAEKVHAPWIERHWGKIAKALDRLDGPLMPDLTSPLEAGHISVGCALGYLDFRHADRDWRQGRPALAQWFEAFAARPSMMATAPE